MPTVTLLYFGSVTDITGSRSEQAEVPATTDELKSWLDNRFPPLTAIRYLLSVNRRLITGNSNLADGDEVALLPPFAGG